VRRRQDAARATAPPQVTGIVQSRTFNEGSLAFGGGVLPLALATDAGSGSPNAIGTGVFGGMVAATFLGLLFVPLFFVVVTRLATRRGAAGRAPAVTSPAE
jgi:hypothetical protein